MFHNKKGELKYIETNEQAKTWLGKIWQGNIPKYEVMIYLDHSFGSDPPPFCRLCIVLHIFYIDHELVLLWEKYNELELWGKHDSTVFGFRWS